MLNLTILLSYISVMTIELKAERRLKFGKANRSLRAAGLIPAELYGRGIQNLHLVVKEKDFNKIFKEAGETGVIQIEVDGEKHPVLIHEVDRDYLSGAIVHVDFHQIQMNEKIRVHVPVEVVGDSPAVKGLGGVLNRTLSGIEVEAFPADLPQKFTVDISGLTELNQSIYVRDIALPQGVQVLVSPDTVVLTITTPVKEDVAPAAPVEVGEIKVETEEKKAEREKKKGAGENLEE